MAIVALMGPPGSGKTTMGALTAPRKPVHVIDVDRKIGSMASLQEAIGNGGLTYWTIDDPLTEDSLSQRLQSLVKDEKSVRPPKGWTAFANYCGRLDTDPDAKGAGTWMVDSTTQLGLHLKAHIQWLRGKSKFVWDDWNAWASVWKETTTILIDAALSLDKDLIVTFHERVSEIPSESTSRVLVKSSEKGGVQREYLGAMDVKIAAAIEGAFGLTFGAFFTEVYALRVEIENGKPKWVCRVLPDGKRDLRTSFDVGGRAEWPPDFKLIWSTNKEKKNA